MQTTPPNLNRHAPVAYIKLSITEILADSNIIQDMKV